MLVQLLVQVVGQVVVVVLMLVPILVLVLVLVATMLLLQFEIAEALRGADQDLARTVVKMVRFGRKVVVPTRIPQVVAAVCPDNLLESAVQ